MTDEVKAELLRIVEEDPIAYLDEMQERLAMSTNIWVCQRYGLIVILLI